MQCPFCLAVLEANIYKSGNSYFCDNSLCVIGGEMTRFKVAYDENEKLIHMMVMSEDLHIDRDLLRDTTVISRLEICILLDSVIIPCTLPFDFESPNSIFDRAKKLLIFS